MGSFNHRFAQPTRFSGQRLNHDYPVDRFPFTYARQKHPFRDMEDGLLTQARASHTVPKIIHTQSSSEYWHRAGSLTHTDPLGTCRDTRIPRNVRLYTFGGTQHGPAPNILLPEAMQLTLRIRLTFAHHAQPTAQIRWLGDRVQSMPASVIPHHSFRHLCIGSNIQWDSRSCRALAPTVIHQPNDWFYGGTGIRTKAKFELHPPRMSNDYRVLVPKVDLDGNEIGCLQPPEVAVALGTYASWNLYPESHPAHPDLVGLSGAFFPFETTKAGREESGDPRRSIRERYPTQQKFVSAFEAACKQLVKRGFLLDSEVHVLLEKYGKRYLDLTGLPEN